MIPTAEEFLEKKAKEWGWKSFQEADLEANHSFYKDCLRGFAMLHRQEALEAAGNKAIEIQTPDTRKYVSKKAILNSYSSDNIK